MTINISYPQLGIDTSSPLALSVNSASPAFKITQTGAGDCFLVEDSASTDTTPFVINAAGRVLKGRPVDTGGGGVSFHEMQITGQYGLSLSAWTTTNLASSIITFTRSKTTTVGNFVPVTPDMALGTLDFWGSLDSYFLRGAQIQAVVDSADVVNGTLGGRLVFRTRINEGGGVPFDTMRLDSQGFVGINQTAPISQLHIGSSLGIADSGTICIDEKDTTPATPADGSQAKVYMKSDKIVIQYNDAGTVKYRYMDLTDTTATWTYTTTAP